MRNLPPLVTLEPAPPPQRRRLDTDGSFELVGISEVLGEPELIANRFDLYTVENCILTSLQETLTPP